MFARVRRRMFRAVSSRAAGAGADKTKDLHAATSRVAAVLHRVVLAGAPQLHEGEAGRRLRRLPCRASGCLLAHFVGAKGAPVGSGESQSLL